jgi:hypothetical protein
MAGTRAEDAIEDEVIEDIGIPGAKQVLRFVFLLFANLENFSFFSHSEHMGLRMRCIPPLPTSYMHAFCLCIGGNRRGMTTTWSFTRPRKWAARISKAPQAQVTLAIYVFHAYVKALGMHRI